MLDSNFHSIKSSVVLKKGSSVDRMRYICSENIYMHESTSTNISDIMEESSSKLSESSSISTLPEDKSEKEKIICEKKNILEVSKEAKLKYGAMPHYKPIYSVRNVKPSLSKKKLVPISNPLSNSSAKVVLFERNVEIKDLESKVKYLQNKLKDLENENRTLQNVQSQQERELKKFKEGVAEIPSLLRSHKGETKVYQSTISSIRRELRDCQKELKLRNENLLKKESHIDKLNINLKQSEKLVNNLSSEIKALKISKKDIEEANKMLVSANETLKRENDSLCKNVKDLTCKIQTLEEAIKRKDDSNQKIKKELDDLNVKMLPEFNNEDLVEEISCYLELDSSGTATKKQPLEANFNNENADTEKSIMDEVNEEILPDKKSIDKTKDALIHAFKQYQNLCKTKLNNSDAKPFGAEGSNQKVLPPLRTSAKSFPAVTFSDNDGTEYFSFHEDVQLKDRTKYHQCKSVSEECCKLASQDNARFRNINSVSVDSLRKENPDIFEKSQTYGCKNLKNELILNDDQCGIKNVSNANSFEVKTAASKSSLKGGNRNFLKSLRDDVAHQENKNFKIGTPQKMNSNVNIAEGFQNQDSVPENTSIKKSDSICNISKIQKRHHKKGAVTNSFYSDFVSSGHEISNTLISENHSYFEKSSIKGNKLHKRREGERDFQHRSTFSLGYNGTCRPLNIENTMKEKHNCYSESLQNTSKCWENDVITKDKKKLAKDANEVYTFENEDSDFVKAKLIPEDWTKDSLACCQSEGILKGSESDLVVDNSDARWRESQSSSAQNAEVIWDKWPSRSNNSDSHFDLSWFNDW